MKWHNRLTLAFLALGVAALPAFGQTISARRMAMGGVMLAGGGPGSEGANVAYRAAPAPRAAGSGLALPIGLLPLLADPPVLDPDDPEFNVYEVANLVYNPPWNLALIEPDPPAGDITIAVSRNSLAIDLGDVAEIFPDDHSRAGATVNLPLATFGYRGAFVSLMPVVAHYENDLSLNDPLHAALANGAAFTPSTLYQAFDVARGQVATGVALGWAAPVAASGDPRGTGFGVYLGARAKLLRGLAYGDADNVVSFTTRDTLFGTDPVDIGYRGLLREAGPEGGRLGYGFDLGAVAIVSGFEFGLGVNDIATRIGWRVRESLATRDSAGQYSQVTLAEGARYTSEIPVTVSASAATRLGEALVAADVVRGPLATTAHAGAELWLGTVALRAGAHIDANRMMQGSAGAGMRFGRLGLDAALATHSRNVTRERGLDLAVGLSFYPGEEKEASR
jgi:hypothetical protein